MLFDVGGVDLRVALKMDFYFLKFRLELQNHSLCNKVGASIRFGGLPTHAII